MSYYELKKLLSSRSFSKEIKNNYIPSWYDQLYCMDLKLKHKEIKKKKIFDTLNTNITEDFLTNKR